MIYIIIGVHWSRATIPARGAGARRGVLAARVRHSRRTDWPVVGFGPAGGAGRGAHAPAPATAADACPAAAPRCPAHGRGLPAAGGGGSVPGAAAGGATAVTRALGAPQRPGSPLSTRRANRATIS